MRPLRLFPLFLFLCGSPLFAQNLACTPNGDGTLNCVPQEASAQQQSETSAVQSIDAAPEPAAPQPVAAQPATAQPAAAEPAQQLYVKQADGSFAPVQTAQPAPAATQNNATVVTNYYGAPAAAPATPAAPKERRSGLFYGVSISLAADYLLYSEANASLGGLAWAITSRLGGGNDQFTGYFIYSKHMLPDPTYEDDYTEYDTDGVLDFENFGFGATIYGDNPLTFSAAFGVATTGWWEGGGYDYAGPFVRIDLGFEAGKESAVGVGIEFTYQMTLCDDYVAHFFGIGLVMGNHHMVEAK